MGVDVQQRGCLGVACPRLQGAKVYAAGNLQGGERVPEGVRRNVWQVMLYQEFVQPVIDRIGRAVARLPVDGHIAIAFGAYKTSA